MSKEVMQQALDALKVAFGQTCSVGRPKDWQQIKASIAALTAALALPDAPWPLQTDTDAQFDKKLTVYGGDAQPVTAQPKA